MNDGLVLMLMAGGAGTRFWPWSTDRLPKQFLQLVGQRSLLQETYERSRELCPASNILVLTHENYRELVAQQLPQLKPQQILCEPLRRDTAAAVAYGALWVQRNFGNPTTVLLTTDHWIQPYAAYQQAIEELAWGAQQQAALYTMGIRPTYPATGYGYLRLGPAFHPERPLPHRQVVEFREKPPLAQAQDYLASGDYLWNSGMFAWTNQVILDQFQQHLPAHLENLQAVWDGRITSAQAFERLEKISLDFAIMEKAPNVRCLVPDFTWSDLGGWLALEPFLTRFDDDNLGRGRVHSLSAQGNMVVCEDPEETVALLGVDQVVVVRVGKRTLVVAKERCEEIKQLLARLPAEELL